MHLKTAHLTYLSREASIADSAFEGTFFRMTPVMNLQGRITSKRLETQVTGGVPTT